MRYTAGSTKLLLRRITHEKVYSPCARLVAFAEQRRLRTCRHRAAATTLAITRNRKGCTTYSLEHRSRCEDLRSSLANFAGGVEVVARSARLCRFKPDCMAASVAQLNSHHHRWSISL